MSMEGWAGSSWQPERRWAYYYKDHDPQPWVYLIELTGSGFHVLFGMPVVLPRP